MFKLSTYLPLLIIPLWLWVAYKASYHISKRSHTETLVDYCYHNKRYHIYYIAIVPLGIIVGMVIATLIQQY